jgi:hypothetical protein
LRALYGLELMALLRQLRKSAIAALAAVSPALLVLAAVPATAGALQMMAGAAVGALGWAAAIWLQRHPLAGFLRPAGSQQ